MRAAVSRHVPGLDALPPPLPGHSWTESLAALVDLDIVETDSPQPERTAGRVEIEVQWGGLNESDLNSIAAGLLGLDGRDVHGFGREVLGRVVQTGDDVDAFGEEDLVVTVPRDRCGRCSLCREGGRRGLCLHEGPPSCEAFQERLWVDASGVAPIPSGLNGSQAVASAFDGGLAVRALEELQPEPGQTVAVTAAPSALSRWVCDLLRQRDVEILRLGRPSVLGETTSSEQGSVVMIDPDQDPEDAANELLRRQGLLAVDAVIDPAADVFGPLALSLLRPRGTYLALGLAAVEERRPSWRVLLEKELTLRCITQVGADAVSKALGQVAAGVVEPRVAARFPLAQVAEACHTAWWRGPCDGKVLVHFNGEEAS